MQNSYESRVRAEDEGRNHRKNSTKVLSKTTMATKMRNNPLKTDHSKDKELINSGLHKLVSSFNTVQKVGQKQSKILAPRKQEIVILDPEDSPTEREEKSHIVLSKQASIDKYTMTEFDGKEEKLDLESTALGDQTYKDLQWTDPRLLKKYSLVKQTNCKKSLTIPYISKSEYGSEIMQEPCSDDESETGVIYADNKKTLLFKCLYYFCTTSVSVIGSMCGITLITIILWKMLDETIFNFHIQIQPPRNELLLKRMLRAVAGQVTELANHMIGKIMRLLTISTSEVFAQDDELASGMWYQKLY